MECKGYYVTLKIITVLVLWISTTRGCNEQGVRVCLMKFGLPNDQGIYTCNSDSFETCLNKTAYSDEHCTSQVLLQGVESVRQLQASTDCVRGGVPYHVCMQGEPQCTSELIKSVSLLSSASLESTSFSLMREAICFCEDKSSWVDELIHKLQQCLNRSGYADCPANVKAKYEGLLNSQKPLIQTIITNENACSQIRAYTPANCECTREVDKCTNTHLGSDFREKQNKINPRNYPACLEFGTEEEFRAATGCLLRLPSECGQQNFTNFITSKADNPIYFPGYFVFLLRYECAAACANKQQTAHSALGCLVSLGLENWTVEEIKGLQGQEKNEYCRKVDTATKCAAEKFSACPGFLLSVTKAIQEYKAGKPVTENTQEIPVIVLEMFEACDTDLLKYTNLLMAADRSTGSAGSGRGSTASNKAVQKLVSVISIFMLFLVQFCVM